MEGGDELSPGRRFELGMRPKLPEIEARLLKWNSPAQVTGKVWALLGVISGATTEEPSERM